jgi:iron complex outermembrane receptor protein
MIKSSILALRPAPHRPLSVSFIVAALVAASASQAVRAADEEPLTEVIITGTRIVSPNMKATSPTNVVTAEEIKSGGRTDIADVLNLMPQLNTNDIGQGLGNRTSGLSSAGGVANADLRGLGPNRTLVMVNGRRLGAGSPNTFIQSPAPDLDQIPSALIERVDVLTGGASAVYGSDAIAGVVNFITKRNFEGVQIDYDRGFNWHNNSNKYAQGLVADAGYNVPTGDISDGKTQNATVTMGSSIADGRGNVTAFIGYTTTDPVRSGARDFGACQMNANDNRDGAVCGGSINANLFEVGGLDDYQVAGNQFIPWGSSETTTPPYVFNSQKYIYANRDNVRYNAGFMAHVDVADEFKPYTEFMFMNDRSTQEIAPSAMFFGSNPLTASGGYLVNCSNPLLSTQQRNIICSPAEIAADTLNPGAASADLGIGRRNVEGGGRVTTYEHTNYRGVVGAKGSLGSAWNYDAYGQYYYTNFFTANGKYLSFQSIANGLQVTGTAANPTCISGGSCVPYNIFTEGGVTQKQLDYLYTPGTAAGNTTLRTVHADITGDLGQYGVKLPTADEGVGVNLGYENRNEKLVYAPDAAQLSGLLAGGNAAVAIDKSQSVSEQFIEARVPIMQKRTGVYDLVVDGGYRRSDYSVSGSVNTYKLEVQYAPVADYRIRASYQRAIRAPSLIELFNPQSVGQISFGNDPCAPTRDVNNVIVPAAATLTQCQASGVTSALYGNGGTTNAIPQSIAAQLTQLTGGNPDLKPETAKTYTVGVTFEPNQIPGFSGSIDYYKIKISDEIGSLSANQIVNDCIFGGSAFYCAQLKRNPITGGLNGASVASGGYIVQTSVNVASSDTEGVDLQAAYKLNLERWGSLNFMLNGAYLIASKTTPQPGAHTYDCAGLFGPTCQTVNPTWRHNLRAVWTTPWDVSIAATWRYAGSVNLDNNSNDVTLKDSANIGGFDKFNAKIGAFSWLDLSASWKAMDKLTLRAGINNVFDKDPPLVTTELVAGGAANTYAFYDMLGRQVFASFSLKL